MNRQMEGIGFGDLAPTESMQKAWSWACGDLKAAVTTWKSLNTADLVALNGVFTKSGMQAIKAAPGLSVPGCSEGATGKK